MAGIEKKGANREGRQAATFRATFLTWCAAAVCVAAPLYPSISINLDAAQSQGVAGAVAGIMFVVMGAACFHRARTVQGAANKAQALALFLFFVTISGFSAVHNISAASEGARDLRRDLIEQRSRLSSQRSQWAQAQADMAAIVGNTPLATFESDLAKALAVDSGKWQATKECNPSFITVAASKTFCASLEPVRSKIGAARKRDEAAAKAMELDSKLAEVHAPETEDPLADWIASVLAGFGRTADLKVIAKVVNAAKAAGVEVMGATGPDVLLAILFGLLGMAHSHNEPQKGAKGKPASKVLRPGPATTVEAEPVEGSDKLIDGFVASCLEFVADEAVKATPLYEAWQAWCSGAGVEPGSQRRFSERIQRRVKREEKSGRPQYVGVKLKLAEIGPRLRVVSG